MAGTLTVQNIQGPTSGANANQVLIPSGHTLHAPGHVVQVVSNQITVWTPTASTTYINTGVQLTITPKYNNSKILIIGTFNSVYTDSASEYMHMALYRDSSNINAVTSTHGQNYGSGMNGLQYATALCHSYLDSPATTSATVYAFYMRSNGGGSIGINNYGSTGNNTSASTITAQEIAQ